MGPSQLLRWCNPTGGRPTGETTRKLVTKGQHILHEGIEDDGLYLLYRGWLGLGLGLGLGFTTLSTNIY